MFLRRFQAAYASVDVIVAFVFLLLWSIWRIILCKSRLKGKQSLRILSMTFLLFSIVAFIAESTLRMLVKYGTLDSSAWFFSDDNVVAELGHFSGLAAIVAYNLKVSGLLLLISLWPSLVFLWLSSMGKQNLLKSAVLDTRAIQLYSLVRLVFIFSECFVYFYMDSVVVEIVCMLVYCFELTICMGFLAVLQLKFIKTVQRLQKNSFDDQLATIDLDSDSEPKPFSPDSMQPSHQVSVLILMIFLELVSRMGLLVANLFYFPPLLVIDVFNKVQDFSNLIVFVAWIAFILPLTDRVFVWPSSKQLAKHKGVCKFLWKMPKTEEFRVEELQRH